MSEFLPEPARSDWIDQLAIRALADYLCDQYEKIMHDHLNKIYEEGKNESE